MAVFVVVSGLLLLAMPGLMRRWGRSLAPSEWARLSAVGLSVGALMLQVGAVLIASPTVLRTLGAPAVASACERTLGALLPGGPVVGWVAAAVAATMPALAWVGVSRARRGQQMVRIEPDLGEHVERGRHDVVVLPTDQLVAVSVDGDPPQIVVSSGLIDALPPEQLDAVLRHEAAHLDHGHQRYLVLATAAEHGLAFFPLAGRSTATMRASLERWADEVASGAAGCSRGTVRNALLGVTAALVGPAAVAAFSPLDSLDERVDALSQPPQRISLARRTALYLPGAVVALAAVFSVGFWVSDVQSVLAMTGRCTA